MDSVLLQRFCPRIVLDSKETVKPVDLNTWADTCVVKDDAFDNELKGSIGQNLANPSCYLEAPFRAPAGTITAGGERVGEAVTSVGAVPLTGKVDTLLYEGQYYYCMLYMLAFPPADGDRDVAHYVKVLVGEASMKVAYAVFGVAGAAEAQTVVSRNQLQFADRVQERVMVYVSPQSHRPLPRAGKFWRSGPDAETVTCDGQGAAFDPSAVRPLSNVLMQFKGRLAKPRACKGPCEQGWWSATVVADVDRIWQRFMGKLG